MGNEFIFPVEHIHLYIVHSFSKLSVFPLWLPMYKNVSYVNRSAPSHHDVFSIPYKMFADLFPSILLIDPNQLEYPSILFILDVTMAKVDVVVYFIFFFFFFHQRMENTLKSLFSGMHTHTDTHRQIYTKA